MQKIPGLKKVRDVHALVSDDVVSLVDAMGAGGGFMGRNLADAAQLLDRMCSRKDCVRFLSFPAAIAATGTRGLIVDPRP